jgi:hypothetical protein
MIEVYKKFRPNGVLDQEYYNTTANFNWLDSVYDRLDSLRKYIWNKVNVPIEEFYFGELGVGDIIDEHNRIINLKKLK